MINCRYCGTPFSQLKLEVETIQRIATVLADGSKSRAVDEVQFSTSCSNPEALAWVDHFEACCKSWPYPEEDLPILQQIDDAFGSLEKPDHFTDFTHCDECEDHDKTLLARTRETLRRQDLGNPGWDPLNFTTEAGIGYLFPALARFALMPEGHGQYGWYGDQLIWHLSYELQKNRILAWCSTAQRLAVCALLEHLLLSRQTLVSDSYCTDELSSAIKVWRTALIELDC